MISGISMLLSYRLTALIHLISMITDDILRCSTFLAENPLGVMRG